MINEENKREETANVTENTPAQAAKPKKLPLGALIGIIAGAVAIVVAIVLIIALGGDGKKCDSHIDADDNFKCDNCGVDFEDGFEVKTSEVTFTVKVEDGDVIPGVEICLTRGEEKVTVTAGDDGRVTATLDVGTYFIEYNYDTVPSGFFQTDFEVEVKMDTTAVELKFIDNNPDGTEGNPFFISEDETEIVIEPGQEIFYSYRGAVAKNLTINSDALSVTYNGETYEPVDGVVSFFIVPEIGVNSFFSVKNNSDNTVSEIIKLISPLGSMENPIVLEGNSASATVPAESVVYYNWTATESGVLIVNLTDKKDNAIALTRVLAGDIPVSSHTAGDNYAYIIVAKDDVITVSVSTDKKEESTVDFSLEIYAGTESEPVPVLIDFIDLSYMQGESISFSAEAGKTVTVRDEDNIKITYGGEALTPEKDKISFTVADGDTVFTVENTYEGINSVIIEIK